MNYFRLYPKIQNSAVLYDDTHDNYMWQQSNNTLGLDAVACCRIVKYSKQTMLLCKGTVI